MERMRSLASLAFKLDVASAAKLATNEVISGKSRIFYDERTIPVLMDEFGYSNNREVPIVEKVTVYCHFRQDQRDDMSLKSTLQDVQILTGEEPIIIEATPPLINPTYKLGDLVSCKVTLTQQPMYNFMDKLLSLVPISRDTKGLVSYGFLTKDVPGVNERFLQHIDVQNGVKVILYTSAESSLECRRLLMLMGLPYQGIIRFRRGTTVPRIWQATPCELL